MASYTLLLNHLHNPHTKLTLQTIQGALSHHLATLEPLPTPLAATAISCPYFLAQPLTFQKLNALSTAFRHAAHIKFQAVTKEEKERGRMEALFMKSRQATMDQWVRDVVRGLQGGHPVLRLASCSGLLLGVEDLKYTLPGARGVVEDEDIVALAEVMDTYGFTAASNGVEEWEKEFQPAGQDLLSIALIFASQSFPLIPQNKLKVLPLPLLSQMLTSTICATFKNGSFLSSVSASVTLTPANQVHISASSAFAQTIQSITSSPLTASISSIARFTSNILSLLLDLPSSHLDENMQAASHCLQSLRDMAKAVERDWISTSLASVTDEHGIAEDTKELSKSVWSILKTLLFTTIMVSDAALSASIFLPPIPLPSRIAPTTLALQTLHTLSHLAFVISQFGGVTSTSPNSFLELKKTFYLALDILAQGDGLYGPQGGQAEEYVQQVCVTLTGQRVMEGNLAFRQAKEAFALASIEQLVPVLSGKCIKEWVWAVCYPHLYEAGERETYESAHSTVLAMFAAHAQQQQQQQQMGERREEGESVRRWVERQRGRLCRAGRVGGRSASPPPETGAEKVSSPGEDEQSGTQGGSIDTDFVKRMVPFYSKCLIENSTEGKLSTVQLRMAYAALVRSASACGIHTTDESTETYALAWYCVQMLLDTIHDIVAKRANKKGKARADAVQEDTSLERLHRLQLTLVSTLSSLPLPLLAKALDEILSLLTMNRADSVEEKEKRKEVVEALFSEILEGVGDREKEYAIVWWYKHRAVLGGEDVPGRTTGQPQVEEEKVVSRL